MNVTVKCPQCGAALPVAAGGAPQAIRCGRCAADIPLRFTPAVCEDCVVDACPVCGGGDFYLRKDFDPKTGLTVVIVGALMSAGFYWLGHDLAAYVILASAVLIDLLVYQWLGDVTICYRCHAEFRGKYERTAGAFDLHTADELEKEYERKIGRR